MIRPLCKPFPARHANGRACARVSVCHGHNVRQGIAVCRSLAVRQGLAVRPVTPFYVVSPSIAGSLSVAFTFMSATDGLQGCNGSNERSEWSTLHDAANCSECSSYVCLSFVRYANIFIEKQGG